MTHILEQTCYTLPSKRNATLGSGAPTTLVQGQWPQGVKRLLAGVVSPVLSHRSSLNSLEFRNSSQNAESMHETNLALNPKIPLTSVLLGGRSWISIQNFGVDEPILTQLHIGTQDYGSHWLSITLSQRSGSGSYAWKTCLDTLHCEKGNFFGIVVFHFGKSVDRKQSNYWDVSCNLPLLCEAV